jgi:hypothetical protein
MIKIVNYSIEEDVLKEFNMLAKENCLNKSKYIEKSMIDYIIKNKK